MTTERTSAAFGHGSLTASVVNPLAGVAQRATASGHGALTAAVYPKIAVNAYITGNGALTDYVPFVATQIIQFTVTGHFVAVADPSVSGDLNSPVIQPVNALVTFTPRLAQGELFYVPNFLVSSAYNAEQTINLLGTPTGGTFTLSFGGYTTNPALPWNATPAQVQSALAALPTIGAGNVQVVADVEPYAYDVEFIGSLGLQGVPVIQANADGLSNEQGAGYCEATVTATSTGAAQVVANTAVAIPTITARIYNGVLCTIDITDTPGVQLTANSPELGINGNLIYDVAFSSVSFNGASQYLAPFAFMAPTYPETICLSDPNLNRLDYALPDTTTWTPSPFNGSPTNISYMPGPGDWRTRARRRSG